VYNSWESNEFSGSPTVARGWQSFRAIQALQTLAQKDGESDFDVDFARSISPAGIANVVEDITLVSGGNHGWDDDDDKEDDDADDQAHPHLHILPPHLFPDSVGASSKSLGGDGEIIGLVLQGI